MMNIRLLIFFIMLLSGSVVSAQSTAEHYRNDIAFLKRAFEQHYPSLYRINTEKETARLFNEATRGVNSRTNAKDFYRIIKKVLAGLHDGHLASSPPDSLDKAIDEKEKYFPLSLKFIDKHAYVDCDRDKRLPAGTEIISIDGKDISLIRKTLFEYLVADGNSETRKYYTLNRTFWFYYNLVYGAKEIHLVRYLATDGKKGKLLLRAETLNHMSCRSLFDTARKDLLKLEFPQENTALLSIRSFSLQQLNQSGHDFKPFIDSAFNIIHLRNSEKLIIDLRNNTGGKDAYGALLYSYLTDQPFSYYKTLETTSGALTENDHEGLKLQHPSPKNFKGKVYILVNGMSFSVTSEFCAIARSRQRAVFVGEETGGMYEGNTSGVFKDIVLPYSKVSISVPAIKYTMDVKPAKDKNRGIVPEHNVMPGINELLGYHDLTLNFILNLVK